MFWSWLGGLIRFLLGRFRHRNAVHVVFTVEGKQMNEIIVGVGQTKRVLAHLLKADGGEDSTFENAAFSASDGSVSVAPDASNPLQVNVTGVTATADGADPAVVSLEVDVAGGDQPATAVELLNNTFAVRVVPVNAREITFEELP